MNQKGISKLLLAQSLGCNQVDELLRECELPTDDRPAASCLFFTLGAQQVGRAAIDGWKSVLAPSRENIHIWPFDSKLNELLKKVGITVAEIYPREAYSHLGISFENSSKRDREARKRFSELLLKLETIGTLRFSSAAKAQIHSGFESDDDFDAMVSLLSMLKVLRGELDPGEPDDPAIRNIEGWILGQKKNSLPK